MAKRIVLLAALLVLILSLPLPVLGAEDPTGTIEGQLINGTAGGSSVADVEVHLKTFTNNETGNLTTKTRSDGKFTFSTLSIMPPNTYQIFLTYRNAEYLGDNISFVHGQTSKSANITVYDSTSSDASIKIKNAHTIINMGQGTLDIMVMYDFINDTDRAYVGNLTFSLPPEAFEVEYGYGLVAANIISRPDGFTDTMAMLPKGKEISREIIYYYNVPYTGGDYNYHQKLNYPVVQFDLLVQDDNLKVISDQLSNKDPLDMGIKYLHLTGNNLGRGETVSAALSPNSAGQTMTIILVAAALIVMIVASFLVYRRTRGKSKAQPVMAEIRPTPSSAAEPEQIDQRLLAELAQLDDDFAAGSIQEEAYRAQRAAKKAQLVKLLNTSRGAGGRP